MRLFLIHVCLAILLLGGCDGQRKADPAAEAPPPVKVEHEQDVNLVQVDHPDQFPLVAAVAHVTTTKLVANGVVNPDVSRTVPVISLASGRVVQIDARLGDTVQKGQLLVRIQSSDIAAAFSDYRKAVSTETLTHTQSERAQLLYAKGATSLNDLQTARQTENNAKVDVETSAQRIQLLGADVNHPTGTVDVLAPTSGVVVEQNVTASAGVKSLDNSPNLFTIADLSSVWVVCDVYENDLSGVTLGEPAEVRVNAYPQKVLTGRVNNIGAILDPAIRTAKVRIEIRNPGFLKVGMFASAIFHSQQKETTAVVPAAAVLHLHDRDWVYVPAAEGKFRRVEVICGDVLPGNMQEIVSGLQLGQQVVAKALILQSTTEQ